MNELPFAEKFFSENLARNELNEILGDLIEILLKSNYTNNKFDSNFHKEDFLNMLILIYYIAREYKEYYIEKVVNHEEIKGIKNFINKDFKRKQLYIKILDNYTLQEINDCNETIYSQIKEYLNIH